MPDSDKKKNQKSDPTENPDFKKVVKHFLNSPPRPHDKETRKKSQGKKDSRNGGGDD